MDVTFGPFRSLTGAGLPRRRVGLIGGLLVALSLVVIACGDSDDATGPNVEPAGKVDQSGGVVRSQSGRVELNFPPGAVSAEVSVTVEPASGAPPNPGLLPGAAFDFGPDGTQFAQPVDLTITYDPSEIPDDAPPSSLVIHKAVGNGWVKVGGSQVLTGSNKVKAPITSFSVFAVISIGGPNEITTVGDAQNGVVGEPVGVNPSLVVLASDGTALSGVGVTFRVVEGGGSVTGANKTTDAQGRASVGSWTLGTTPGLNALEADVVGLATPVRFEANAQVGPPAAIVKTAGDGQEARRGTAVDVPPAVMVTDAFDNPVQGVEVIWVPDAGGTVDPGTVDTDADGMAAVTSWTLGDPGENTLAAQISGVDPAVFTAMSIDPCEETTAISMGETLSGELTATDCAFSSGRLTDLYGISFSSQTGFQVDVSTTDFDPAFFSFTAEERQVAGTGTMPALHLVAPGSYELAPTSLETTGVTGSYDVSVSGVAEPSVGCAPKFTFVTTGVTIDGNITGEDCEDEFDGEPEVVRWVDDYLILVRAGETITATMTADFTYRFTMWEAAEFLKGEFGVAAGTTTTLTATASETSFFGVFPISDTHQGTGSYTITVEVSGGSGVRAEEERKLLVPPRGEKLPLPRQK